jgi:hypothetical protein
VDELGLFVWPGCSGRYASASCLAASSRYIPVPSFGRFDEITHLVEKTSDLTHALARRRRVRRASPTATLRVIRHFVPHPFGVALQAIYDAARRGLLSLRPCRYIRVSAFGRFDEITHLVENASALTLPDFERSRTSTATSSSPNAL